MFPARYPGKCWVCKLPFDQGESIAMLATEDSTNGVPVAECCIGQMDDMPRTTPRKHREPETVLPRGKTAADRCGRCFQVPASNGVCGCF